LSAPFRFKQFTISQEHAPMKVGTDGVLLGAWCPCASAKTVLDIGTGTGLIALMVAQRNPAAIIHTIEPNAEAFQDARLNFSNSSWSDRIHLSPLSLEDYEPTNSFDLIICNPPFFQNSLRNPSAGRSEARHNLTFSPADLVHASQWLQPGGFLSGIYPPDVFENFHQLALRSGLTLSGKMEVKPTPEKQVKRVLFAYTKTDNPSPAIQITSETLIIESRGRHQYSDGYLDLTGEFYLG